MNIWKGPFCTLPMLKFKLFITIRCCHLMCNSVDISQIICHKMLHAIWNETLSASFLSFSFLHTTMIKSIVRICVGETFWWFYRKTKVNGSVWHSLACANIQNFIIFQKGLQKCKINRFSYMNCIHFEQQITLTKPVTKILPILILSVSHVVLGNCVT